MKLCDPDSGEAVMPEMACGVGLQKASLSPDGSIIGAMLDDATVLFFDAFTGERLSAQDARTAGLVTRVTAPGEHVAEAGRLAALIATKAPIAVAAAKRILQRGNDDGYSWSIEAIAMLHGTADQKEGVSAFLNGRTPQFQGK